MNHRGFKGLALALAFAVSVVSCSDTSRAPDSPLSAPLYDFSSSTEYTPVKDALPLSLPLSDLTETKLIGISGGSVTLLGHSIVVPSGAVTSPTFFTIAALPTGYVEVSLLALVPNLLSTLNIGEKGFAKPVALTLTYSRSPTALDPSHIVILYDRGRSVEELPTTVDTVRKTATAKLNHFSKYAMATN